MKKVDGTTQRKKRFLAAFRETGNIRHACERSGVSRSSHYDWVIDDPGYKSDFAQATEDAADLLEAEARRRAHEGLVRYKFGKGGEPLTHPETGEPYREYEYSDTLLIFLLKGLKPEVYRERYEHTVVHPDVVKRLQSTIDAVRQLPAAQAEPLLDQLEEVWR